MKNIATRLRTALVISGLLTAAMMLAATLPAAAQTAKDQVCQGIGLTANNGNCDNVPGDANVESLIPDIIGVLSYVVGIASIIVLVIGGLKFITSAGDANKTSAAKNTVLYAIVGLVIVLAAQAIVWFVFKETTT